jgi:hypothetical protein
LLFRASLLGFGITFPGSSRHLRRVRQGPPMGDVVGIIAEILGVRAVLAVALDRSNEPQLRIGVENVGVAYVHFPGTSIVR